VLAQGLVNAPGAGGSEAVVDRQCLPQRRGSLAGAAVMEVAGADSWAQASSSGARRGRGHGQGLGVVVASLAAVRGAGQQLAQVVERLGLAVAPADAPEEFQGLAEADGGGRVVLVSRCKIPSSSRMPAAPARSPMSLWGMTCTEAEAAAVWGAYGVQS